LRAVIPSASTGWRFSGFVGGSRFGVSEAVAFGASRVEKALAVWRDSGLSGEASGCDRSVSGHAASARAYGLTGRREFCWSNPATHAWGGCVVTAGGFGAKPTHHSRSTMPATASRRPRGQLGVSLGTSVPCKRLNAGRGDRLSESSKLGNWTIIRILVTSGRLQRLERGIFLWESPAACLQVIRRTQSSTSRTVQSP
jgi:hypothetical protein